MTYACCISLPQASKASRTLYGVAAGLPVRWRGLSSQFQFARVWPPTGARGGVLLTQREMIGARHGSAKADVLLARKSFHPLQSFHNSRCNNARAFKFRSLIAALTPTRVQHTSSKQLTGCGLNTRFFIQLNKLAMWCER